MTISAPVAAQPPTKPLRPSDTFVDHVLALCESKKAQADLRTGLGLPVERCNYLHRYLVPRLSERLHPDAKRAHYAVAALIAARPRSAREATAHEAKGARALADWHLRPNLGAALAEGARKGVLKPDSAEGDLHLMARQSSEAIHPRLPALTRHLLTSGVAIDWAVMLEDLSWWNRKRDNIATRWLESYFRVSDAHDDSGTEDQTPKSSEENN
ncbi:type I-E CRISPR-associated protein Cse2/CasB [Streptomyces wuyuanensis]|uniref:type I-E CRISPR-associated protein Cse2/CasB n=1 Tax=Streptomyces wuyuanensis TaxID=1196353 RepID=UPI0036796F25